MGIDIADQKARARKQAFAARKAAHSQAVSPAACAHLVDYLAAQPMGAISAYMPIRTEVDILPAMHVLAETREIGVPVIQGAGKPLEFHLWNPKAEMVAGPFGAMVPKSAQPIIPRIIILPLVAYDLHGYRLGYGGGFYDRTLEKLQKSGPVTAIGFAYSAQLLPQVPIEATDQRLDAVITEKGATQFQ